MIRKAAAALALLLTAEAACRVLVDAPFLGISKELFVPNAYGDSMGNAPNAENLAFGVPVFTDAHGFRSPPRGAEPKAEALLILGDSVAFGPGVEEEKTLSGILRARMPRLQIHNSAVIGYALPDYRNVVARFLPEHPEVKAVVLIFCLNDLLFVSAENIRALTPGPAETAVVEAVRRWPGVERLNEALRSRSKLYLFLKDLLTDPSKRYFLADLDYYGMSDEALRRALQPLAAIRRQLAARKIPFTVLISPYAAQLRHGDELYRLPQRRLLGGLHDAGIEAIDLLARFKRSSEGSALFLRGDPMHLSQAGHRLVADAVVEALQ